MKCSTIIFSIIPLLTGCSPDYVSLVKDKLHISYVLEPPSTQSSPYSLTMYTKDDQLLPILECKASHILGTTDTDINEKLQQDNIAEAKMARSGSDSGEIKIDAKQYGNIGAKYEGTYSVELSLTNGQIFGLDLSKFNSNGDKLLNQIHKDDNCWSQISFLRRYTPGAKWLLPMYVYSYDFDYKITNKNTGEIIYNPPPELAKIVLSEANLKHTSESSDAIKGGKLFVGFNGPDVSRKFIDLFQEQKAPTTLQILDVTSHINSLK